MDTSDLKSLPMRPVATIDKWGVVCSYDETFQLARILKDGMSKEEADAYCGTCNLMYDEECSVMQGTGLRQIEKMRPVTSSGYCTKCANSGVYLGEICTCRFNPNTFFRAVACLDVPEQYRGLTFSTALLPDDIATDYKTDMNDIYALLSTGKGMNHNYLLCSPHKHGKTVFAYACMERMFRGGLTVFPLCDVMELRRLMRELDMGKPVTLNVREPENLWKATTIFVKIPTYPTWEVFDTMSTLVSRRVRNGGSVCFLYSGDYRFLIKNDSAEYISSSRGDGAFSTLDVKVWKRKVEEQDV